MTRKTAVDHVVLTRFNLPTAGVEGLIRAREGWLLKRVELFEHYCAPSVAQQTRPVRWLVYFDPESPDWLLPRLAPAIERGLFQPVLRASVSTDDLIADIRAAVPEPRDVLLTTNLDNDDALASDFSERLVALETSHRRAAIYAVRGLIAHADRVFLRTDRHNAFCSVREPWSGAMTSWSGYHNELGRSMPVIELRGAPAWLQVIHDTNVSNRVRGRLVAPEPYRHLFGSLLDDFEPPDYRQVAADVLLRLPVRAARDGLRTIARVAGLRLLGKDRYQAAKARLSSVR